MRPLCSQCFKDWAFGYVLAGAQRRCTGKHALDASEVGDLAAHIGEVKLRALLHLCTGLLSGVDQSQQASDLVNAKSKFPRPQDEAETSDMALIVSPVAIRVAWWLGQQVDLLVIPDGFDVAPRPLGDLAATKVAPDFVIRAHQNAP
jgi:hypothetical protein